MNEFEFFKNMETAVNTEFFVNKEKRTIACVITTKNDFLGKLIKYGFAEPFGMFRIDWDPQQIVEKKYVGIAKCAPEDEWNENFGRDLAEARAMNQRKADLNVELANFVRRTYANLDNLYKYGMLKEQRRPQED